MRSSVHHVADLDRVADANPTGSEHVAVERRSSVELPIDLLEHGDVLLERVRVVRGHHAAPAHLADADHGVAEQDLPPDPLALGQSLDAVDQ